MVTRGNERGITFHRLHLRGIRLTHINHRLLQQMFQKSLMSGTHLVELIYIDQPETSKIQFGIPLFTEIDTVRIILIQTRGQQIETESGLPASLSSHQERRKTIAMLFVTPLPMHHHRQKPSIKQLLPPHIIARDACSQRTDAILAIPHGQMGQIILDRSIIR